MLSELTSVDEFYGEARDFGMRNVSQVTEGIQQLKNDQINKEIQKESQERVVFADFHGKKGLKLCETRSKTGDLGANYGV